MNRHGWALLGGLVLLTCATLVSLWVAQVDLGSGLWRLWPLTLVVAGLLLLRIPRRADLTGSGALLIVVGAWSAINTHAILGATWVSSWPILLLLIGLTLAVVETTRRSSSTTGQVRQGSREGSGSTRLETAETIDEDLPPRGLTGANGFEASLILIASEREDRLGARYRLEPGRSIVIGRSESAEISLPESPSVSRHHAALVHRGSRVTLRDLDSKNGTYVNDERIDTTIDLSSGDRIQVGSAYFKILHQEDVEQLYHEAIYDLLRRDGLTQIHNRRMYDERAGIEVARALRYQRLLSLIIFDIDHFKEINDEHGHLFGDAVLKQITATVRDELRGEQVFARVGGEEFAILCPETSAAGASELAERLRSVILGRGFSFDGTTIDVTCSFGVAQLDAAMEQPEDLFQASDEALYRSKEGGRNRVTVHGAG